MSFKSFNDYYKVDLKRKCVGHIKCLSKNECMLQNKGDSGYVEGKPFLKLINQ